MRLQSADWLRPGQVAGTTLVERAEVLRNCIRGWREPSRCRPSSLAVVKVPPLIGCVKYKAQDVVLAVEIPLFTLRSYKRTDKNPRFCCGSREIGAFGAGIGGGFLRGFAIEKLQLSLHLMRVGFGGFRRKAQEWCNRCGLEWKAWKRRYASRVHMQPGFPDGQDMGSWFCEGGEGLGFSGRWRSSHASTRSDRA